MKRDDFCPEALAVQAASEVVAEGSRQTLVFAGIANHSYVGDLNSMR